MGAVAVPAQCAAGPSHELAGHALGRWGSPAPFFHQTAVSRVCGRASVGRRPGGRVGGRADGQWLAGGRASEQSGGRVVRWAGGRTRGRPQSAPVRSRPTGGRLRGPAVLAIPRRDAHGCVAVEQAWHGVADQAWRGVPSRAAHGGRGARARPRGGVAGGYVALCLPPRSAARVAECATARAAPRLDAHPLGVRGCREAGRCCSTARDALLSSL